MPMRPPSAGRIALLGRRNANRVPDWACRALHRQLRTVRWPGGAGPVLSAAGSLHHLLTPWPAVCHGARAATRTNTRRASRSGAHIRACSSAGRVLAERCLGISRLVVCWFACVSSSCGSSVRIPAIPHIPGLYVETRERSRAEPQRRGWGSTKKDGDICHTENEKPSCTGAQSTHHSHTPPAGV
jgi:hypothetical protein